MSKDKEKNQSYSSEEKAVEDIIFEDEEVKPEEVIKKLRERLKECESLKQEYLEGWQRAKADFINLNRKIEEDKTDFLKFANEDLIIQLIPVLDSFEEAFRKEPSGEATVWKIGMKNIYEQLKALAFRNGAEEIKPEAGTAFNPVEHEIMSLLETSETEKDGRIIELIQKGYKLNGKILRAAKVRVGELTPDNKT